MASITPIIQCFYKEFYGASFFRHFRRPPYIDDQRFKIQSIVKNPQNICSHVHLNNGNYPCYTHVYDHGSLSNLKKNNPNHMVFDRVFFDFDVHDDESQNIKKTLQSLRSHGLKYELNLQNELKEQLRNIIKDERIENRN